MSTELIQGMVVRDRKWGGRYVGSVVKVAGERVFVSWHGTCVEDELDAADVEACSPPPDAERWADGGIAVLTPGGAATLPVRTCTDDPRGRPAD